MLPRFDSLALPPSLLQGVAGLGFEHMTPVQASALPGVLAGEDLMVQAETGSGKTLAFGLGMLARALPHLPPAPMAVRALCVCPTRELAEQVAAELRKLARRTPNVKVLALCGGVPFAPQRASLKPGAHLVVGTPGRLEEHLRKGSLRLDQLELLVLDEADRMLDMGFAPQLDAVVAHLPGQRQTLLFSATLPAAIAQLSAGYQRAARRIEVEAGLPGAGQSGPGQSGAGGGGATAVESPVGDASSAAPGAGASVRLEQHFFRVRASERGAALTRWLAHARPSSALIFCNTRAECAERAGELRQRGWVAAAIHGELSQRERAHVLRLFANESCTLLTATDVAARGWDIGGLGAVVNLGLSRDPSVHLHRIGRTGRAGQAGLVAHFVAEDDLGHLAAIERAHGFTASFEPLPEPVAAGEAPPAPRTVTLRLSAGKDKKLRPGDILGALTAPGGVAGSDVGAIQIEEDHAYVAVVAPAAERALSHLETAKIKGRSVRVRRAELDAP